MYDFNSLVQTKYEPLKARGYNKWTSRVGKVAEMSRVTSTRDFSSSQHSDQT